MNTATATTATVSDELVGQVARLKRSATGRAERVLVDDVVDLDDGDAVILGRLLYATNRTAYGRHDSRGRFTSNLYSFGDTVDVELPTR